MMLKNFKELKVWQKAYQLCPDIYKITKDYPPNEEKYGLSIQMKRAAVSIPSSIAERYGRKTIPDYVRCLYIAYGSTCEIETQSLLSGDLNYFNKDIQTSFLRKLTKLKECEWPS